MFNRNKEQVHDYTLKYEPKDVMIIRSFFIRDFYTWIKSVPLLDYPDQRSVIYWNFVKMLRSWQFLSLQII